MKSRTTTLFFILLLLFAHNLYSNSPCSPSSTDIEKQVSSQPHKPIQKQLPSEQCTKSKSKITCLLPDKQDMKAIFTSFEFDSAEPLAKLKHKDLNFSPFFITQSLLDTEKIHEYFITPFIGGGREIKIRTEDGVTLNCTYFNRNSDTLVIIGTGFGNEPEKAAPFVHLLDNYDLAIFTYRGHGYNQPKILDTNSWTIKPSEAIKKVIKKLSYFIDDTRIPHLDVTQTTLGEYEEKDLFAVIDTLKKEKEYKKTYGVGLCFSSFVFAKAAAKRSGLFDKLILDSSLYSPQEVATRITESPELIFDPQKGLWEKSLKKEVLENPLEKMSFEKFIHKQWFKEIIKTLLDTTIKLYITPKSTGKYLSKLNIPILFFHGKQDKITTYKDDFIKNWEQTTTPEKAAFIFEDGTHLTNEIKYKELYKLISKLFLDLPYNYFVETIKDSKKFIQSQLSISDLYKVNCLSQIIE